jgi:hypothetical protein
MATFAVIDADGNVVNSVELDEDSEWKPPDGCTVVRSEEAGIGGKLFNGVYTPPPAPEIDPALKAHSEHLSALHADADANELTERLSGATPAQLKEFANDYFPSLTPAERLLMAKILLLLAKIAW